MKQKTSLYIKYFILILFITVTQKAYSLPINFTDVEPISYQEPNFLTQFKGYIKPVKESYFLKTVKQYAAIHIDNSFYLYFKPDKNSRNLLIDNSYNIPNPSQSIMIIYLENAGEFALVEIFFINSSSMPSSIYSITGYIENNLIRANSINTSSKEQKLWLYGTFALIYAPSTPYFYKDILENKDSLQAATLIFIPDNSSILNTLSPIFNYPFINIINKKNKETITITDRNALNYFIKYEIEAPTVFQKYKGGAISFQGFLFASDMVIENIDGKNHVQIDKVSTIFLTERDKFYKRSYSYQKSPYQSAAPLEAGSDLIIYDAPNGEKLTHIEAKYYKSRDVLYTPWNNVEKDGILWYAVILPKLDKAGFVNSLDAKIIDKKR